MANVKAKTPPAAEPASFKKSTVREYFESMWSQPMLPTGQDRLLVGLLTPKRLLDCCAALCCSIAG